MKYVVAFILLLSSLQGFAYAQTTGEEERGGKEELRIDDVRDVPRGFYSALNMGYFYFTDESDRSLYGDGWVVGIKFGYDIFKYLAVELLYRTSGHQNAPRGLAEESIPGSHFSHQFQGMIRGNYPISRRWTVSAEAGGGMWVTRPNIKPNIRQDSRGMGSFGLGVQYFTKIRGIVIGLDPSISIAQDLEGPIAQATGYIRYTF